MAAATHVEIESFIGKFLYLTSCGYDADLNFTTTNESWKSISNLVLAVLIHYLNIQNLQNYGDGKEEEKIKLTQGMHLLPTLELLIQT